MSVRLMLLGWLVLLMLGCQTTESKNAPGKEGYFTWVDESGQVRSSPIRRDEGSLEDLEATAQRAQNTTGNEFRAPAEETSSKALNTTPAVAQPETEYTLENYPDGDELAKSGFLRPGDPVPYFTWRDTDGNFRVSYYRPDTRSEVEKGLIRQPVELTPAQVFGPQLTSEQASSAPSSRTEAFDVLGIEALGVSFFEQWQNHCCEQLLLGDVKEWSSTREFELEVDENDETHGFSTGISPYRLVRLPDAEGSPSMVVRVRSFDTDGLFIPSIAFLDHRLGTVRVVTDLAAVYRPESWHRVGYIEAFVPAFPNQGEYWMLVFTRDDDVATQTVIETRRGPRAIPHQRKGLLSLTEMQP
ncbi:MalM family protein [Marinobacter caseinilyticus]|uniref:MalM family protein n=1 Tax=Marinobacter caseinilyticus TaxID=2692195 RepID=UPI001F1A1E4E|nr:MalM family protein [Marinobacter caseinilyticus]